MASRLTKKQQTELTEKLTGIIQKNNALQLRLSADRTVNELNVNQISGELNRIHYRAIGKDLPAVITFAPKQAGSGDPSPTNIRPIVGYEIDGIETVYGGELNIETGVLTVTYGIITLDGTNNEAIANTISEVCNTALWEGYASVGVARAMFVTDKRISADPKGSSTPSYDNTIWCSTSAPRMWYTVPKSLTNVTELRAYLAQDPITVVYPIATPETYTLTPQQMFQLLDQL